MTLPPLLPSPSLPSSPSQHLDYRHWYDRQKLILKEIQNVQYVASMNPTAGSFTINTRLQRHFSVFAISFPQLDSLRTIYLSILQGHVTAGGFSSQVQKNVEKLVNTALALHQKVTATFLPTAIKFHYIFNLRDLSNIFQVHDCTYQGSQGPRIRQGRVINLVGADTLLHGKY